MGRADTREDNAKMARRRKFRSIDDRVDCNMLATEWDRGCNFL
jgi:hypothetical protein